MKEGSPSGCQLGDVDCPEVHVPGDGNGPGPPLQFLTTMWRRSLLADATALWSPRRTVQPIFGVDDHVRHCGATAWSDRRGADAGVAGGGFQPVETSGDT